MSNTFLGGTQIRFEAKFEGPISLFKGAEDDNSLKPQFESAGLVIKIGTEISVAVEVAFTLNVNTFPNGTVTGDPSPTFHG